MFRSNDQYIGRTLLFPADWMEHYKQAAFAGTELHILEDCDKLLTQCYGENYMEPICEDRNKRVHDLIRAGNEMTL